LIEKNTGLIEKTLAGSLNTGAFSGFSGKTGF
jgi:hypothetical protein